MLLISRLTKGTSAMKQTTKPYLDLSATSVEGDDGEDVRAVGVDSAGGVGGVVEPEVSLVVSEG